MPTEPAMPVPSDRADDPHARDAELMRLAQTGDFSAFQELVERFRVRVFRIARRILGQDHDAEDATQQTFLSLVEHIDSFRWEASVQAWILRIATNQALKVLRKRRGLPSVSLTTQADVSDDPSGLPHPDYIAKWQENPVTLAQRAEVRRLMDKSIAELNEKLRTVFVLRDIEGLSVRETAEVLGITESNVKVRLLRARLQLRELLTHALGDDATRLIPDHTHG